MAQKYGTIRGRIQPASRRGKSSPAPTVARKGKAVEAPTRSDAPGKLEMKYIVTIHWNPGTPKAYQAYPPVEARDAKAAIQIVRESIGHSFTMRATAALVDEAAYTRTSTSKGV
jgi:hypothetical protein